MLFTSILLFATSWEIHLFLLTSHIKIQPFIFSIFDLLSMSYQQFIFHFSILRKLWGMNNVPVVRKNPSYASRTANYTFWDWKSFNIFCQSVREFLHYINTTLILEPRCFELHTLVVGDGEIEKVFCLWVDIVCEYFMKDCRIKMQGMQIPFY